MELNMTHIESKSENIRKEYLDVTNPHFILPSFTGRVGQFKVRIIYPNISSKSGRK